MSVVSANVFPRQIRLPPRNGMNASGLRGVPSGLLKYSELESKRSGMKSNGFYHSFGFLCISDIAMKTGHPFGTFTPWIVTSLLKHDVEDCGIGVS